MERLHRHIRSLLVAMTTLALSAGMVFAGGGLALPDEAADGLEQASEASGLTVPVGLQPAEEEPTVTEEEPTVTEEEPTVTEEEPTVTEEEENGCPPAADEEDEWGHGAKVCAVANGPTKGTPEHGQVVSEAARDNHGAQIAKEKAANGGLPEAAVKALESVGAAGAAGGRP